MNNLKGTLVNPEKIYGKSAYEIAVMHGFDGSEEEWLDSILGDATRAAEESAAEAKKAQGEAQTARNSAQASSSAANAYRLKAEGSATAASNYAGEAMEYAENASKSEVSAKSYEEGAKASEKNAKTAEENAKASEAYASQSAEQAAESAREAHTAGYNAAASAISDLKISWTEEKESAIAEIEGVKQEMIQAVEKKIEEERDAVLEEIEKAAEIVQTTGDSPTAIMSQAAVTMALGETASDIEFKLGSLSVVEDAAVKSGAVIQLDEAFLTRETANGASIVNGAKTVLKRISGNSAAEGGILRHSTIEKITSKGRNLLDQAYQTASSAGVTYTVNADKSITAIGTATDKSYFDVKSFSEATLPAGTYSISGNAAPFTFLIQGRQGGTWKADLLNGSGKFTVDYSNYNTVLIKLYAFTGSTANCTMYPMLTRGGSIAPYEPYALSEYSFPNRVELKKYDYIDIGAKKIVRKSYSRTFVGGSEYWSEVKSSDGSNLRFGITVPEGVAKTCICSAYEAKQSLSEALSAGRGVVFFGSGQKNLQVVDTSISTLGEWLSHLANLSASGTPFDIVLESATKTEEDIDIAEDGYLAYDRGTETVVGGDTPCSVEQLYVAQERKVTQRTPIITFIDDDGASESLANWEMIGDAAGIRNTFALVTSRADMDWDEVERLQNKGHEFISHTHTHPRLNDLSADELAAEFKATTALLREHGCNSKYLVYPYNSCGAAAVAIVKKYFSAGILGEDKTNTPPITPFTIKRQNVLSGATTEKEVNGELMTVSAFKSFEEFKAIIDETIANRGWCVFMSHLFTNKTSGYYCDEEARSLLVDVCKYAIKNGAKVEPFGKAFEVYKNRLDAGAITDSKYCIVDCDGVVYEK